MKKPDSSRSRLRAPSAAAPLSPASLRQVRGGVTAIEYGLVLPAAPASPDDDR